MYTEIQAAVSFLSSLLYNKLPRRKVNLFAEQLANYLLLKYQNHWYPEDPQKGSAFRCIHINENGVTDALIAVAAQSVGLDYEDLLQNLPNDVAITVDPGEVSYTGNEDDIPRVLYASDPDKLLMHQLNSLSLLDPNQASSLGSHATTPSGGGSESLASLSPSPYGSSSPSPTSLSRSSSDSPSPIAAAAAVAPPMQPPAAVLPEFTTALDTVHNAPVFEVTSANDIKMTVGMFAQTRFGTTKLKRRECAGGNGGVRSPNPMQRSCGVTPGTPPLEQSPIAAPPFHHSMSVPHNLSSGGMLLQQQQQHLQQQQNTFQGYHCGMQQGYQQQQSSLTAPGYNRSSSYCGGLGGISGGAGSMGNNSCWVDGSGSSWSQDGSSNAGSSFGFNGHVPLFARPTSLSIRNRIQADLNRQSNSANATAAQQSNSNVLHFDSRYWECA